MTFTSGQSSFIFAVMFSALSNVGAVTCIATYFGFSRFISARSCFMVGQCSTTDGARMLLAIKSRG